MEHILPFPMMVFDVESIGLLGQAFAVGWVTVDRHGVISEARSIACDSKLAIGNDKDRSWVEDHVTLPADCMIVPEIGYVRSVFWVNWYEARENGIVLAADVPYPVETNFLNACLQDQQSDRRMGRDVMPYPLIDIASVRMAAGFDPLETCERLPSELPAHNPLCDARQSARLLVEAMRKLIGA